jgi:hypothetical protein
VGGCAEVPLSYPSRVHTLGDGYRVRLGRRGSKGHRPIAPLSVQEPKGQSRVPYALCIRNWAVIKGGFFALRTVIRDGFSHRQMALGYPPSAVGYPPTAVSGHPTALVTLQPPSVTLPPTVELGLTDGSFFFFGFCSSGPPDQKGRILLLVSNVGCQNESIASAPADNHLPLPLLSPSSNGQQQSSFPSLPLDLLDPFCIVTPSQRRTGPHAECWSPRPLHCQTTPQPLYCPTAPQPLYCHTIPQPLYYKRPGNRIELCWGLFINHQFDCSLRASVLALGRA